MSNLAKLLTRSGTLARQGDLAGARAELERAVKDHGRNPEPWISLAAVHGMSGHYADAQRCARRAADLAPHSLQAWINLAYAAQSCGDYTQAVEAFRHARGLPGCPSDVALQLGLALVEQGQWAEAETSLREHLGRDPGHREAILALGKALAGRGDTGGAIALLEPWCRRYSQDVQALTQLGAQYLQVGRTAEAWRVCEQVNGISPEETGVLFFRGGLLMAEGRYEEARDVYEQLLRLTNPSARLYLLAAQACREVGDPDAYLAYARAAVEREPSNINALTTLSESLTIKDLPEARKWMEAAVALAPEHPTVMTLKGRILELEGDKAGAWECVRSLIEDGDLHIGAASVAAAVAPAIGKADELIPLLEQMVEQPGIMAGARRTLYFTLASLCDKAKQYDRAFGHAQVANRLKHAWYDHNSHRVDYDRLRAVYAPASIQDLPRARNDDHLPVFIVGMPRSGTSLLEQILSCHSQVHARGETADIGNLVNKIPYYPDGMRNLSQDKLDTLAGGYLQHLRELAPDARIVTDKMPGNYIYLGFISQLLPGARIINCRRDPRDISLSHFMIEFGRGLTYSYDLETLALACKEYQDLMTHWKAVLPIPILDVRYEDLIADPHTWVARVLDFCGLEWEDACLDFHKSKRHMPTASYDQVRKPLYSSSVARWKHYARHLEPITRILGLPDDGYP